MIAELPGYVEPLVVIASIVLLDPSIGLFISMLRMSKPERILSRDDRLRLKFQNSLPLDLYRWIEGKQMSFESCWKMDSISMMIWRFPNRASTLAIYLMATRVSYEFSTRFQDDGGLDTNNMRDCNLFPAKPGSYKESLKLTDYESLYEAHLRSLGLLAERGTVPEAEDSDDFTEILCDSLRRDMKHVRSHFLWPLRAPYWFFIRRKRMFNKTIEDQFRIGLIQS